MDDSGASTIPLWLTGPPDEARLAAGLDALARMTGRDPASPPTAAAAFRMARELLASGRRSDADRGRCWLWAAASLGLPAAATDLARQVSEAGPACPGAPPSEALMALVSAWLERASRGARPEPPRSRRPADLGPDHPDSPFETSGSPFGGDADDDEDAPRAADEPEPGPSHPTVVVLPLIGDRLSKEGREIAQRYAHFIGAPMAFRGRMPDPAAFEAEFLKVFPWAAKLARYLRGQFSLLRAAGQESPRLPPLLLVGPSGCGKTTMLEWIAAYCEFPSTTVPVGGTNDAAGIAAVPRGWHTAQPCAPSLAMAEHEAANPCLILDELDKGVADGSGRNGSVTGTLLSMLKPPSGGYRDAYFMAPVDLSHVTFMASANSLAPLAGPLLARFLTQPVPSPGLEHFPTILRGTVRNEARRLGVRPEMLPWISPGDEAWLRSAFERSGCNMHSLEHAHRLLIGDRAADEEIAMRRPN